MTYPNAPHTNFGLRRDLPIPLSTSGTASDKFVNNNSAALWVVRQISLISTNPLIGGGLTCTVRPPTGIIDTSYFAGTGDVAGGDPPIYLRSSEYIELTWSQATSVQAGLVGLASFFYDEVIL